MSSLLTNTTRDLTARLEEGLRRPADEGLRRRELRDLARGAVALAEITLASWDWVRETLAEEGLEGRELARHCRVILDGIGGVLAAHERLRGRAAAAGLTPEAVKLDGLSARLDALLAARPAAAEALALAARPPRPVDEARLTEARASGGRGESITLDDDYLARLRAGADL